MTESLPLLIAKIKNARFMKDDYALGWLRQDSTWYIWITFAQSNCLQNAIKIAKEAVEQHGDIRVLLSETPIEKRKVVYETLPPLKEIEP